MNTNIRLKRRNGKTFARVNGSGKDVPVRVAWARPLTGWGREVVLVDEKKREVAMLGSLDLLDHDSRHAAEEAIHERYIVSTIHKVNATKTHFGVRFWDVDTDRGRSRFAVKDPSRSVLHLTDDRMLVRDTLGNSYAIGSLAALDQRSRDLIENVV